jgi:hypothetical protein
MADVIEMPHPSKNFFADMFDWINHPRFTSTDPIDWLAFAILLILAGLLWSKVVKQTLDTTIEVIDNAVAS